LASRERFWIGEPCRQEALSSLVQSEGIDEVLVVSNCSRTEFIAWTQDAGQAANSVLRYLTRSRALKLSEWSSFYRLLGDEAVAHVFRASSGLDTALFGKPVVAAGLAQAWQEARTAGTTGRFLDATVKKAAEISAHVQQSAECRTPVVALAEAAVEAASERLGGVRKPKITILGAGEMAGELARAFCAARLGELTILSRSRERAQRLAQKVGGHAVHAEDLRHHLLHADLVMAATSTQALLSQAELEFAMDERDGRRLLLLDLGVPRNIDAAARAVPGVELLDIDKLCEMFETRGARPDELEPSETLVQTAVTGFLRGLLTEGVLPTLQALRARLGQICNQEVKHLSEEFGPFTGEQYDVLHTLSANITQRLAASLARQLKELPDHDDNKVLLTSALQQLFELEVQESASTIEQ